MTVFEQPTIPGLHTPHTLPAPIQAAHCESGVTVELLRAAGLDVSEPLAFGIGSGVFFTHMPFVKVTGLPVTAFRSLPGTLFGKTCARLGVKSTARRYLSRRAARRALDEKLAAGVAVGLRTNIHWLTYFPKAFRFNFNGHHIVVTGRRGEVYDVRDPVVDTPVTCHADLLERARFARGPLAPHGYLFHVAQSHVQTHAPDLGAACLAGLRESAHRMTRIPLPYFGARGIALLARRLGSLPSRGADSERIRDELAFVVRMQEEIGTGGAGFRYLFAAFLEEAAFHTGLPALAGHARTATAIGDVWREFAVLVSRMCKGKEPMGEGLTRVQALLTRIAAEEQTLFLSLGKAVT